MGIRRLFDAVILSVQAGWRKPHRQIFTTALDELGIAPQQAVFVGDSYWSDYHGPTQAGIRSFLIDPAHVIEVPDHARLEPVLDLAATLKAIEQAPWSALGTPPATGLLVVAVFPAGAKIHAIGRRMGLRKTQMTTASAAELLDQRMA